MDTGVVPKIAIYIPKGRYLFQEAIEVSDSKNLRNIMGIYKGVAKK